MPYQYPTQLFRVLSQRLLRCFSRLELLQGKFWAIISQYLKIKYIILLSFTSLPLRISVVHATPAMDTLGAFDSPQTFSAGLSLSPSSSYYNPASLSWAVDQMSAGIIGVKQSLALTYDHRPEEAEILSSVYSARPSSATMKGSKSSAPLPSILLKPRGLNSEHSEQLFFSTGLIKTLIQDLLTFGMTAMIPLHRFELQAPSYPDERAQYFDNQLHFERWGDSLEGLSVNLGLGLRLSEEWGLGMSLTSLNQAIATSQVFLSDASYQGLSVISPKVEVFSVFSPSLSVTWRSSASGSQLIQPDSLKLLPMASLTVHGPEEITVEGSSEVKIWNYPYPEGEEAIVQRFTQHYRYAPIRVRWGATTPLLNLGIRGALARQVMLFTGGMWSQWSTAKSRSGDHAGWSDQVEVSGGAIWSSSSFSIGSDLRWRPSPVPEQSGRSSYVDPHQAAIAMMSAYQLREDVSLQFNLQIHYLPQRRDVKDQRALSPVIDEFPSSFDAITGELLNESIGLQTNNPGYPGYESRGVVWVGGLTLIWSEL